MGFKTATIDSNVEVQINNSLNFLYSSSEGVHNSSCESMPIFADYIVEVIACVSVVEVHGQFELLCEVEVVREDGKLLLLSGIVQSVII